jgi:hypothetical protein
MSKRDQYLFHKIDDVRYDRRILDDMLDFIVAYKRDHDGAFPSLRALAKAFDINSTSTAQRFRNELQERGDLTPIFDGVTIVNYSVDCGEWVHDGW